MKFIGKLSDKLMAAGADKVKTIKLKKAPVRELFDLFFKLVLAQFLIDK